METKPSSTPSSRFGNPFSKLSWPLLLCLLSPKLTPAPGEPRIWTLHEAPVRLDKRAFGCSLYYTFYTANCIPHNGWWICKLPLIRVSLERPLVQCVWSLTSEHTHTYKLTLVRECLLYAIVKKHRVQVCILLYWMIMMQVARYI